MTEFQKEIACMIVLLSFFLGCFGYVEIVHTETVIARGNCERITAVQNATIKSDSFENSESF